MADWTRIENELLVKSYFEMLHLELNGIPFNKSEHRRKLTPFLPARSKKAIENKHQNTSAVMIKLGLPYIIGYAPFGNYQNLLEEVVLDYVNSNPVIEKDFNNFVKEPEEQIYQKVNFKNWIDTPPEKKKEIIALKKKVFKPIKKNYLEIEQRNQSRGKQGEQLVYDYEIWRLKKISPQLSKQVVWVSQEEGDGAGYDILSRNKLGNKIFIEVKSTSLGKETPIFFTKTENEFSKQNSSAFHLYRVFNLKESPKIFIHQGKFEEFCSSEPIQFKGYFG